MRCFRSVLDLGSDNVEIVGPSRSPQVGVYWALAASQATTTADVPCEPITLAEETYFGALPDAENVLVMRTDTVGDFATYTLLLLASSPGMNQATAFDPQLSEVAFSFKVECPSDFDCRVETVCPPADKDFFIERLRKAKRYGFNYAKSCVELFTKEFLDAADELGYLVCQEMPFGLKGRSRLQRYDPPVSVMRFYSRELERIITSDRNHASVALYSMASELDGRWLRPKPFAFWSRKLPAIARRLNPRAVALATDVVDR